MKKIQIRLSFVNWVLIPAKEINTYEGIGVKVIIYEFLFVTIKQTIKN